MFDNLTTEIRSFHSLQDLRDSVVVQISQYKTLVEEYSERLGSFLRDLESTHSKEEWFKNLSALHRLPKKTERSEKKKKGGKEKATSTEWVPMRGVLLSASEQGEVEILFDAIEEMKSKIEQLSKVKEAVDDLERLALGKEIVYVAYVHEGAPEKIVLRYKKGGEPSEKFNFATDFSILKEI